MKTTNFATLKLEKQVLGIAFWALILTLTLATIASCQPAATPPPPALVYLAGGAG